jgi:hypothetical protein
MCTWESPSKGIWHFESKLAVTLSESFASKFYYSLKFMVSFYFIFVFPLWMKVPTTLGTVCVSECMIFCFSFVCFYSHMKVLCHSLYFVEDNWKQWELCVFMLEQHDCGSGQPLVAVVPGGLSEQLCRAMTLSLAHLLLKNKDNKVSNCFHAYCLSMWELGNYLHEQFLKYLTMWGSIEWDLGGHDGERPLNLYKPGAWWPERQESNYSSSLTKGILNCLTIPRSTTSPNICCKYS